MHVIRISCHILGSICVLILGVYRCINNYKQDYIDFQKITFSKIKIFVMYILGLWHFLYCGFYGWKYENLGNILGVFSYIFSIFYTFFLFIILTLFHERKDDNTCLESICTFFIVLINIFTSIDVLSSDFMFKIDTEKTSNFSKTNTSSSPARAIEAIENADQFLSPPVIEFSLLAIDLLLSKANESNFPKRVSSSCISSDVSKNGLLLSRFVKTSIRHIFFLLSCGFTAFTFTEFLKNDISSSDIEIYVITHNVISSIVLLLLTLPILYMVKGWTSKMKDITCKEIISQFCKSFQFNFWVFILFITSIGSVIYNILSCLGTRTTKMQNDRLIYVDKIMNIIIIFPQTLFILWTYSCKKSENSIGFDCCKRNSRCSNFFQWLFKDGMYVVCSLLSIINLGLWVSESIGKEELIYFEGDKDILMIYIKLSFFLTIFYRFQTGLEFLKLFWMHDRFSLNEKQMCLSDYIVVLLYYFIIQLSLVTCMQLYSIHV